MKAILVPKYIKHLSASSYTRFTLPFIHYAPKSTHSKFFIAFLLGSVIRNRKDYIQENCQTRIIRVSFKVFNLFKNIKIGISIYSRISSQSMRLLYRGKTFFFFLLKISRTITKMRESHLVRDEMVIEIHMCFDIIYLFLFMYRVADGEDMVRVARGCVYNKADLCKGMQRLDDELKTLKYCGTCNDDLCNGSGALKSSVVAIVFTALGTCLLSFYGLR